MLALQKLLSPRPRHAAQAHHLASAAIPVCEQLEQRRLLYAYVVEGTDLADTIDLKTESGYLKVYVNSSFPRLYTDATQLIINAKGGNDRIRIDSSVTMSVVINGGEGNDTIVPGETNETLRGGNGIDVLDCSTFSTALSITLDNLPNDDFGFGESNSVADDISVVIGGRGSDYIDASGVRQPVMLSGGQGNDMLFGGDGNDVLNGNEGVNSLDGGGGKNRITGWGPSPRVRRTKSGAERIAKAPPATAAVYVHRGALSVVGVPQDNKLAVTALSNSRLLVYANGTKWLFYSTGIDTIRLIGGRGNDRLVFAEKGGLFSVELVARGGKGQNTIIMPAVKDDAAPPDKPDPDPDTPIDTPDPDPDTPIDTPDPVVDPEPPAHTPFPLYDATYFKDDPDLASLGFQPIHLTGVDFRANAPDGSRPPDETATRALARAVAAKGQMLVLDIEDMPLDIRKYSDAQVQASIDELGKIVGWVRSERPEVKVGFYSLMPMSDYYTVYLYRWSLENAATKPWCAGNLPRLTKNYENWQAANQRLQPLADKVDFLAPCVYANALDQEGWRLVVEAKLQEARKYGKPVLPFMWMDYFGSAVELAGKLIPKEFWQLQLKTVHDFSDGAIIWGGWRLSPITQKMYRAQWDEQADWWQVTKGFLAEH